MCHQHAVCAHKSISAGKKPYMRGVTAHPAIKYHSSPDLYNLKCMFKNTRIRLRKSQEFKPWISPTSKEQSRWLAPRHNPPPHKEAAKPLVVGREPHRTVHHKWLYSLASYFTSMSLLHRCSFFCCSLLQFFMSTHIPHLSRNRTLPLCLQMLPSVAI